MSYHDPFALPGRMKIHLEIIEALVAVAAESARRAAGQRKRRAPRRGLTLQPGPDTPLWNELVRQVVPLLTRRGSKVHLARILGLPRQRLQVCLKAKTAHLDAERTLLLLAWLATRRRGGELT